MDVVDIWYNINYNRSVYAMTNLIIIGLVLLILGFGGCSLCFALSSKIKSKSILYPFAVVCLLLIIVGLSILSVEVKL